MGLLKQKISALVITYNEIGYIENCIKSVDFADEIIVVLLSPVSHKKLAKPDTVLKAGEHLFEHLLAGSYQANLMNSKIQDINQ